MQFMTSTQRKLVRGGGPDLSSSALHQPSAAWHAILQRGSIAPPLPAQGLDMESFTQALGTYPGVKVTLAKARNGDPEAQATLAKWMAKGGCGRPPAPALPCRPPPALPPLSPPPSPAAAPALAGRYNIQQDEEEAARILRVAAEAGHAPAMYRLGKAYSQGRGVTRDLDQAVRGRRPGHQHMGAAPPAR